MTIKQARKILGKLADDASDEAIFEDINTAEILKNLFFVKNVIDKPLNTYNKTNNGKT